MSEYHIAFDTKDMAPALLAVRVRLDQTVERDMQRKFNVALADDPLYEKLEQYVLANPSRARRQRESKSRR